MFRSLLFILFSCAAIGAHAASASHVSVQNGWIRLLPGALPAGAYAELRNAGDSAATLQSASSPDYAEVVLHQSRHDEGMSHMTKVDHLVIPAHGSARLTPGGYHLMLMSPRRALVAGDTVTLRLTFDDGSQTLATLAVRAANTAGPAE